MLSDDNKRCYLRESNYCFRSVVTSLGFTEGVNYWEVVCDSASGNELKVGVTSKKSFNLDSVEKFSTLSRRSVTMTMDGDITAWEH